MKPGSFLWFARHDLRLGARHMGAIFKQARPLTIVLLIGAALILFHGLGYGVARELAERQENDPNAARAAIGLGLLLISPWIVSQALTNATRALYAHGDLDLILCSPARAGTAFFARATAIALETIAVIAIFVLPFANMMALILDWRWLAIYPTLAACGFVGAAIGLALAAILFRICGPRRTRIVSQIMATLIGAGFVLSAQMGAVLPPETLARWEAAWGGGQVDPAFWTEFWSSSFWTLPVRAAAGEWTDLLLWLSLSAVVFCGIGIPLSAVFARGAILTAGADRQRQRPARRVKFRAGAGVNLRLKEWRLLTRDPWLASQLLQQMIYTMPISVILWEAQGPNGSVVLALMPAVTLIAAHMSASLAWLVVSSEDAPEFLRAAPVAPARVQIAKLQAIAVPLVLLLAPILVGIGLVSPHEAGLTALFAFCAALSAALLNLWNPTPGKRGDFLRRHAKSKIIGMIEHTLSLFWAMGLALAVNQTWWFLTPCALAILLVWRNRPNRRRDGTPGKIQENLAKGGAKGYCPPQ